MTILAHPKQHTARTTTLVVERPQNYALLEARFQLVRYLIPDALRHRGNPTDFGRVQNTVRDQLDYPYRSFQHDQLDGAKNEKWAIYVLYPQGAQIGELVLSWFREEPLPRREIAFGDLPLHVLLKLLAFRFFRSDKTHRFVGQDKCYVYARPGGKDSDFHYCVEIELSGAPANTEGAPAQEFRVIPHARCFGKATPQLKEVGVYDNRLRRAHSLDDYVDLFQGMYPALRFVALEDMRRAPQGGVIVLLDATAEDFKEDGILFGQTDPYPALYREHPNIPKHSINVNSNDPDALEGGDYLDYSLIQLPDKDFARNLHVVLSELYLKCAIIYGAAHFPLPFLPDELAFVRRGRSGGETITTALWFAEHQLHFANLGDPTQSEAFYVLLERWGVDWDEQYDKLLAERKRIPEHGSIKDLPAFDIIVGRDLFVAIEDLAERILYEYDTIEQRHQEQYSIAYPIKHFQLAPQYETIQQERSTLLPLEQMVQQGLLDGSKKPTSKNARQSQAFYKQLLEYDAFLEEVAVTHPVLSYQELTSGEWRERIARIFGSKTTSEGKYHRKLITGIYNDLGMFLSERGENVRLYQGIWYDDTNAFLVGSPTSMDLRGQARAHLVRRFQTMQGSSHFDKEQLLATMGVLFVRYKQYTVSPYYFHLIDLYVENVSRYLSSEGEDF